MVIERAEKSERPKFRILDVSGFFGPDDTLYEYLDEIYFDGKPCIEMEPLNEAARVKYVALIEELEAEGRKTAEKLGRPFTGLPRGLDGALAIATAVQRMDMSVMGDKDKPIAKTVEPANRPDEPNGYGSPSKRGRGRPRKEVA